jgi:hypothetical protein
VSGGDIKWTPLYFNSRGQIEEAQYTPVKCKVEGGNGVLSCRLGRLSEWIDCGGGLEILENGQVPQTCSLVRLTVEAVGT